MKSKVKNISLSVLILVLILGKAIAQDFHVSQYDATPHYYNPALTGMYLGEKGDYRIYADYRSQWRILNKPSFTTAYLAFDMPFEKDWGLGGYLVNNRSGDGRYNTFNFLTSGAYKIIKEGESKHTLNVGLQMGIIYKKFSPDKFTFESQYVSATGEFDQTIVSGEVYEKTSLLKFDANMGVYYKYKDPEWEADPFGGFALYNVNMPNESFMGETKRVPIRWVFHGGCDWTINEKLDLRPMILYMNQRRAYEFNIGSLGFYKLDENSGMSLIFGLDYRWKDAIILQLGLKQENHQFRISYDINSSYIHHYTRYRGAVEFSLILTGLKGEPMFSKRARL